MKKINHKAILGAATAAMLVTGCATAEQSVYQPKYKANVPEALKVPEKQQTRFLGELQFRDGFPDDKTVEKTYDFLDVSRASQVFLTAVGVSSMQAMLEGQRKAGLKPYEVAVFEDLMDARSMWLTPQTTTPYVTCEIDTKDGPVVLVNPGPVLGIVDDAFFTHVTDIGLTGPDKGKGGKYLFVGPDYEGKIPKGYFVFRTRGYRHWSLIRLIVQNGETEKAVAAFKAGFRLCPLSKAKNPPKQVFHNWSGKQYNTIHPSDATYYDELNASVQYEPVTVFSPEINGQMASIGIKKGQDFKPDARMQRSLDEGAAIGNAAARSILFRSRNEKALFYPGKRQWFSPLAGGSHEFMNNGELVQDDRVMMLFFATGITPAMATPAVGTGSVYEIGAHDSNGNFLDGGKHYSVTLPAPIPVNNFWSFMVYDGQTRSILETDQKTGGKDSNAADLKLEADGSAIIYFGPSAPEGKEGNWVQTIPNKGYHCLLRLYGPLQAWFDKTWIPGDFELAK
jgi:hypothetical protein